MRDGEETLALSSTARSPVRVTVEVPRSELGELATLLEQAQQLIEELRQGLGLVPGLAARTALLASLLRLVPVVAGADVDGERRIERIRGAHLLAHELLHRRHLGVRRLDEQLVVHLQHEPRRAALVAQAVVDRSPSRP